MTGVPEQPRQGERGRLGATAHRTDGGGTATLLVVHEADGSWTFRGLDAFGLTLTNLDMVELAESILARAPRELAAAWYLVSPDPQGMHHGVIVGHRLLADCGGVFEGATTRLHLDPGQRPPDPAGLICPSCAGEAR